MRKIGNIILKVLPFAVIAGFVIMILTSGQELSVDLVLSKLPDNLFLAWLILLLMYALKSLSVVFPIVVLQIASGMIFPFWSALLLNILGTALSYTIPYLIGRVSGASAADKLMKKYPKIQEAVDFQRRSDWFISFILRAVSCLPADILSMYFGAIGISYVPYITAGVIGTLPGLVPATFVGVNILNPKSTGFMVSIAVTVVSSITSIIIYCVMRNKKGNKNGL